MVKKKKSILNRIGLASIALLAMITLLEGCTGRDALTAADFEGKWKSSRLETPIHLYGNSEWEIISDDGAIQHYGVWQYKDKQILWSYKTGGHITHDRKEVLSFTPREFKLRERDKSITTFSRLE